jgi:hypothetical protein
MRAPISERWEVDPCEICQLPNQKTWNSGIGDLHYDCERCGTYKLIGNSAFKVRHLRPEQRALLSGWVRAQTQSGIEFVVLSPEVLENALNYSYPTYQSRFEYLIKYLIAKCPELGKPVVPDPNEMIAISYSKNQNELDFILRHMIDMGYIKVQAGGGGIHLQPRAYERYQTGSEDSNTSKQVFVAMNFSPEFNDLYLNGIECAISKAGLTPLRIDKTEHTNRIDDEILRQISSSKMIVAEFTNQTPGVYFEAGYALAQGKKVIWVCRRDQMERLHFDIRQYNCIFWESHDELAGKLESRIVANLGIG